MTRYTGKKAVVIGGSTGMGLSIAQALQREGAEVLVTGMSERHLADARSSLGSAAHVVRSDTQSLSDIRALGQQVETRLGALDALFLNAGFCEPKPFAEVTEADYDRTFAINSKGAYFTVQQLLPHMRDGSGMVFTTSIANATGYPGMSLYAGAKAALRAFTQSLAVELLDRRIRVNALSPGFIRTDTMGLVGASEADLRAFIAEGEQLTPMKRIGDVEEVARAALFLAFEATFITGVELPIDGGMSQLTVPHAAAREQGEQT